MNGLPEFTFLLEYRNGRTETKRYSGENAKDAEDVVLQSLSDADKQWLKKITPIASDGVVLTKPQVDGMDSTFGSMS